jgi:hypothetical protein
MLGVRQLKINKLRLIYLHSYLGVQALINLSFIQQDKPLNPVFISSNGIGSKTTLAKNIAYQAVLNGYSILFTMAAQMLNDLAAIDSDSTLKRRLRYPVALRAMLDTRRAKRLQ